MTSGTVYFLSRGISFAVIVLFSGCANRTVYVESAAVALACTFKRLGFRLIIQAVYVKFCNKKAIVQFYEHFVYL